VVGLETPECRETLAPGAATEAVSLMQKITLQDFATKVQCSMLHTTQPLFLESYVS
jgi:hypothetical protein